MTLKFILRSKFYLLLLVNAAVLMMIHRNTSECNIVISRDLGTEAIIGTENKKRVIASETTLPPKPTTEAVNNASAVCDEFPVFPLNVNDMEVEGILMGMSETSLQTVEHFLEPPRESERKQKICEDYFATLHCQWTVYKNIFNVDNAQSDRVVTLVTHLGTNRLDNFFIMLKYWKGPVSASLYTPGELLEETVRAVAYLHSRQNLALHVIVKNGVFYPVNFLRNLAFREVATSHGFHVDGDFVPGASTEDSLNSYAAGQRAKQLYVAPAFGYLTEPGKMQALEHREHLVEGAHAKPPSIEPFQIKFFAASHTPTDYKKWYAAKEPYEVKYVRNYEPYMVVRMEDLPFYPELFMGRHADKLSYFQMVNMLGFTFTVVPDAYIIHLPHPIGSNRFGCADRVIRDWRVYLDKKFPTIDKNDSKSWKTL